MLKRVVMLPLCFLVSLSGHAAQWETSYASFATSMSPGGARHRAEQAGNQKVGPMYQLCRNFNGSASHRNQSSNNSCRLWGQDEFLCKAVTRVTCSLGDIEYIHEDTLEGSYLDERTGAFVHIDQNRQVSMNVMSPYEGGRDLREIGTFNRTGENTYMMEGTFVSAEGCGNAVRFYFTHLNDGTLLVQATSPKRVSAIIFGICRWEDEVSAFYELKKFH